MHKDKTEFNDNEETRSQKSHYTSVCNAADPGLESKNVELSLEVELDDEVRNIIKHPEKCPSALLDVTVIKPKGLDNFVTQTQTLKSDQVKKLLQSMKIDGADKQMVLEKLFGLNSGNHASLKTDQKAEKPKRKSCLSSKSKHTIKQTEVSCGGLDVNCLTDGTNSKVFSMYKQDDQTPNFKVEQIFTAPRTCENLRKMFSCRNKQFREPTVGTSSKEQPCLCQNCAILGVLADSQKVPFSTEPFPEPKTSEDLKNKRVTRKKSVNFKHPQEQGLPSTSKSHDQCQAIFKVLSARINELEKRVLTQEERAVPKDYFKKIVTKLVNHLSKLTHYTNEERMMAQSYRTQDERQPEQQQQQNKSKQTGRNYKYHVNPVLVSNTFKIPAEKEYEPKPCSSSEPPNGPTESLWRWGEEFLTSSRDLKKKVVVLLEDTLRNLKKGWEKPKSNKERYDENVKSVVQELSTNLANTVGITQLRPKDDNSELSQPIKIKHATMCMGENRSRNKDLAKKCGRPSLIPRFKRSRGPSVNVAYVNPQMSRWTEEDSSVSYKVDNTSDDYGSNKGTMSDTKSTEYKNQFLKVLENTKTADKFKLWQNIWNQALNNRQTKNDSVTIQIPDPKDKLRQRIVQIEYTIGDLEELLIGNHRHPDIKK